MGVSERLPACMNCDCSRLPVVCYCCWFSQMHALSLISYISPRHMSLLSLLIFSCYPYSVKRELYLCTVTRQQ